MPEWKNFGDLFVKGFFGFLIAVVYLIPALIILALSIGGILITYFGQIPWDQLATKTSEEAQVLMQPIIDNALPAIASAIPFIILTMLLCLLAVYVLPLAVLSYLEKENFSDAFKIKAIFKKAFTGNYFLVWILMILFNMLLGTLLGLIPILGSPAASFISLVISFSLFGQIYLGDKDVPAKVKRSKSN